MKATLSLRSDYSDKNGLSQVYILYSHKGEVLRLKTGVKTMVKYWNHDKHRIEAKAKDIEQNVDLDNKNLSNKLNKVNSIISEYQLLYGITSNPPLSYVKENFFSNDVEKSGEKDVISLFVEFVQQNKVGKITEITLYYKTIDNLMEFVGDTRELKYTDKMVSFNLEGTTKKYIYFKDISVDFYNKFMSFLLKKEILNTTIRKRLGRFKTFLNEMYVSDKNKFDTFKKFRFNLSTITQTKIITIDKEEVNALFKLDLNERLGKVRDLFLLGCSTGLRYSDLIRIQPENIENKKYIVINIQKTRIDHLRIPLIPMAKDILEKYKYEVPKISNQKLNDYLKEMFLLASFKIPTLKEKITIRQMKGAKAEQTTDFKYNFLTFHKSRASFITNCLKSKVPINNIMAWTGHDKDDFSVFADYIDKGKPSEKELMGLY